MVLDRNNISYVLGYHSLLGSWMMHSPLPHDDTIQLLTRVSLSNAVANTTSSKRQSRSQSTPATPSLSWKQQQRDRLTGRLWNCTFTTKMALTCGRWCRHRKQLFWREIRSTPSTTGPWRGSGFQHGRILSRSSCRYTRSFSMSRSTGTSTRRCLGQWWRRNIRLLGELNVKEWRRRRRWKNQPSITIVLRSIFPTIGTHWLLVYH